ncbi:restriction endonuclease [Leptospira weilii serovar Topaz str. LT2116]|uniref:Restriction endonuclease n=1 Tax=Leptospira weilii serovar Topaz str. LT2116 TaxID=1088540 RepID=M3EPY3_9LEPT|nr:restriction endonuclease [Leptospira weilii serovar Topaz str. LT2116]
MNYKFDIFDDREFEAFIRDIVQKELKVTLQSFKAGKDKGIDCRFSGSTNNEIIIQAKRYTNYNNLKKAAKLEIQKIKMINPPPKRYIFATSLDLNPNQLDEISNILKPFLINIDDIYYESKLNNILSNSKNLDIENKYYKLWITSTNILKRILHNAENNNSDFNSDKIIKNSSLYVFNNQYLKQALKILNKEKLLVITGPPGIGKTTLANTITFRLLANDYKLIYVDSNLEEAERLFSLDPTAKQIILFDDFLGSFIPELLSSAKERKTVNFIEKIKRTNNKLMILTSRTVFFNAALEIYEGFNRSRIFLSKYELNISHYTDFEKAQILYKHISFSKINADYKNQFLINKRFLSIINHRNYTPRLIEYFTNPNNIDGVPLNKYISDFVIKNLDNPIELWKFHYSVHLDDESRMLVDTVFLFGKDVNHSIIESGYLQRLKTELKFRGFIPKHDSFFKSIRTLQDGFIKTKINTNDKKKIVSYSLYNPSLGDFLINYFNEPNNFASKKLLMFSIVSFQSFTSRFHSSDKEYILIYNHEYPELLQYFISNLNILKSNHSLFRSIELDILFYSIDLFNFDIVEPFVESLTKTIKFNEIESYQLFKLIELATQQDSFYLNNFIFDNWDILIQTALTNYILSKHYFLIHKLFERYSHNFDNYINANELADSLLESKHRFIRHHIKEYVEDENLISSLDIRDDRASLLSALEFKLKYEIEKLAKEIDFREYEDYTYYYNTNDLENSIDDYLQDQHEKNNEPFDSKDLDNYENHFSYDLIEDLFSEPFID